MIKKLVIPLLFSILYLHTQAQVSVSNNVPYNTPANLINNVLLGSGVVATNIQYYGDTNQIGFFSGTNTVVGLDSGIVLTTGTIQDIPTGSFGGGFIPVTPNSGGFGPSYFGTATSNNLLTVSGSVPFLLNQTFSPPSSINDAAVLAFDFVPSSDSVEFKYVFASAEWNGYPCQVYNDVFGFFVAGPGINGTYNAPPNYPNQATNVAFFTDGNGVNLPITISSIHPGGNSCGPTPLNDQYYVNNVPNVDIQFNGVTTIMTAKFGVIPCDTYNIALAIGDGQDNALNSAVFIEAKSFSSGQVEINAKPSFNTFGNDSLLYEGCGEVELEFKRFSNLSDSAIVKYFIGGTAIGGTDYTAFPDSIIFDPGSEDTTIVFNITDDGITEGTETIIIKIFPDTNYCFYNPLDTQIVTLYIDDRPPLVSGSFNDTIVCQETTANIGVNIATGVPDYQYSWGTGDTTDHITVPIPQNDSMYILTITDACGVDTITDTAWVILNIPPFVVEVENDTVYCPNEGTLSINVLSGTSPHSYWWNTFSSSSSITVNNMNTTWYHYTVTDQCHGDIEDSAAVVVQHLPLVYNDTTFSMDCTQNSITIFPDSVSSSGATYQWATGATTKEITIFPTSNVSYNVTISDQCVGYKDTVAVGVDINFGDPLAIADFDDATVDCPGDIVDLVPAITGGFSPYNWLWNGLVSPDVSQSVTALNDTTIILKIIDECDSEISDTISIEAPVFDTLSIDLASVDLFCIGREEVITSEVAGGNGVYTYTWTSPWTISTPNSDEEATVLIMDTASFVSLTITDGCDVEKTQTFFIDAESCNPDVPNVITPNGDGVNDYLYLIDLDQFPGTEVWIYNRWGELIYHSTDYRNTWGADNISDGTYFYTMLLPDGRKYQSYVMITR